ncbi:MAG: LicD family protein [Tetragenococcus koreensis]|nr:LicD family protein [Tetragenococcus koreensis]
MENDMKVIQNKSLVILKQLIKIFEENGLTYYLSGGSFLGAVRHEGFIPWDDDVDISMPRRDYELLLNELSDKIPDNLFLQNFKTDPQYRYFITRVLDLNFNVEEVRTGEITHPAVDILPLDGSPNNKMHRKLYFKLMMLNRYLISLSNRDVIDLKRERGFFESIVVNIARKIPFEKILRSYNLKLRMEKTMKKYSMEESEYSGCLMGAYRLRQMVPTSWFGKGKFYNFEGEMLRGPVNYDAYLTQMYSDYMTFPDLSKIESKIHYKLVNGGKNDKI